MSSVVFVFSDDQRNEHFRASVKTVALWVWINLVRQHGNFGAFGDGTVTTQSPVSRELLEYLFEQV